MKPAAWWAAAWWGLNPKPSQVSAVASQDAKDLLLKFTEEEVTKIVGSLRETFWVPVKDDCQIKLTANRAQLRRCALRSRSAPCPAASST